MPWRFVICVIGSLVVFSCALTKAITIGGHDASGMFTWIKIYRESVRTPVFTGFMTLGSFLLTLIATILLRIKEIYDTDKYRENWEYFKQQEQARGKAAPEYYAPLRKLGIALMANVLLAISSAILQMSLGFVNASWAVGICLAFAATTMFSLLFLWWHIAANLVRWFGVIEKNRADKPPK